MSEKPSNPPGVGKRILRVLGRILLGLVVVIALAAGTIYVLSQRGFDQHMEVAGEPLDIPTDAESVARGQRIIRTAGCLDCHAADGGGQVFLRAMPVMELVPTNITRGGPTAGWSGQDWTRAVRHGVRPDGSVMLFMPVGDYRFLDDNDLGDIVAYLRSLPPVRRSLPRTTVGPVGRLLYVKGDLPMVPAELVDHAAPVPAAPPVGPTAEYGRYLAHACTGCHGPEFSGGRIPGTPPDWPPALNLTPHQSGLAGVTEEQFIAAVTTGRKTRGGQMNPNYMPWRQFAGFEPVQLQALYAYLRTLPPKAAGGR